MRRLLKCAQALFLDFIFYRGFFMGGDLSIWHLVSTADPLVKCILFILLLASLTSWTIIFTRLSVLKAAMKHTQKFEENFWSGLDLSKHYQILEQSKKTPEGLENIFKGGFSQFLKNKDLASDDVFLSSLERKMRVSFTEESERLEGGLSILATIGSVSPFVGLFGTVWGIMGSFKALAGMEQATLSMVAPGISEALIATAMGLFVAIPAVVAYNRFSSKIERLENRYENFSDELLNILARQRKHRSEENLYEKI